eukprot:EG_transcript_7561
MAFARKPINIAPDVIVPEPDYHVLPVSATAITYNPPADRLYAPVAGPVMPGHSLYRAPSHLTGHYERSQLSEYIFQEAFRANNREGCPEDAKRDREVKERKAARDKRKREANAGQDGAGADVEADSDDEERKRRREALVVADPARMQLVAQKDGNALALEGDAEKEGLTVYFEEDEKRGVRVARYEAIEPRSVLHIPETYDYQGRSFMHDPLRDSDLPSFLPKKQLHTYRGHNKGVHAIRWFPPHGHLLLSAGFDGKVKLWDVMGHRNVVRTYVGHSKAVKEICFNNDGTTFVSAGFDRFVRIWDTETGKVTATYTTGRQPHCLCVHPEKPHVLLAGMGDKKIVQWDQRSGLITQQYDQHMGPVNTITFIDNNTKFVTTADDKTIRVWEWDIPFAVKYMADPTMSAMPTCTVHPSGKYIAYQSMDNSIKIYSCGQRFRQHKKTFRGHVSSGYACQIAWSPDGKFLCCGDGDGFINFWEWKSPRVHKRIKVHEKVCIGLLWHPVEQSRLATCSWDSTIKLWD